MLAHPPYITKRGKVIHICKELEKAVMIFLIFQNPTLLGNLLKELQKLEEKEKSNKPG